MSNEQHRLEIIAHHDQHGEFVTDAADGFVYFQPSQRAWGHIPAYALRWIADELDRRNAPLEAAFLKHLDGPEGASHE